MESAVRIVVIDYYMSPPIPGLDVTYSEFRGSSIHQIPVLRCFGSNEKGRKVCVHIHGVFPYFYIPYDGLGNAESVMYQLAFSIDKAVNISLNQGSSSTHHVYKISLVSGIPMYGFHRTKHQFFKIHMYNPMLISTVSNLLTNKSILDRVFQPHEAHVNFTLQFMIDYNLHGMSKMLISEIKYRRKVGDLSESINKDSYLPQSIERNSVCELEGDINASNILNQQEILSGKLAVNPGIAAIWEDEKQRLRNKNEDSQLGEFLELKNTNVEPTKTHCIFKQALSERLAVVSTGGDNAKPSLDASVYPAETPIDVSLQNASIIDIHTPSSLELSLDDTVNQPVSLMDVTLTPEEVNVSVDEDAQEFMQILRELAEEREAKEDIEEDSILSQTTKEQADDSNEDFLDLSLPLGSITTPQKIDLRMDNEQSDHYDDDIEDIFNKTLISQLDGGNDSSDCDDASILSCSQKPGSSRSMPSLDDDDDSPTVLNSCKSILRELHINIERLDITEFLKKKSVKRKNTMKVTDGTEKHEKTLKVIRHRIDKMCAKRKLKRTMRRIHKQENITGTRLKNGLLPIFNVKPALGNFEVPSDVTEDECMFICNTYQDTDVTNSTVIEKKNNINVNINTTTNVSPKLYKNRHLTLDERRLCEQAELGTAKLEKHINFLKSFDSTPSNRQSFISEEEKQKLLNNINCLKPTNSSNNPRNVSRNLTVILDETNSRIVTEKERKNEEKIENEIKNKSRKNDNECLDGMPGNACNCRDGNSSEHISCLNNNNKQSFKKAKGCTNMYVNCDGAADDDDDESTSDNEKIETKQKKIMTTHRLSQYEPLKIYVKESPNFKHKYTDLTNNGCVPNISGSQKNFSFKRKIAFDTEFPANSTVSEEYISCAYSPQQHQNDKLIELDYNKLSISEETNLSDHTNSNVSEPDLFVEKDELNSSFFENHNFEMTASEKYDTDTNYKAKEGSSTVFTPNTISNLPKHQGKDSSVSSQHSNCSKTSVETVVNLSLTPKNDYSSSEIVPYQKSVEEKQEHSSGEITSYQQQRNMSSIYDESDNISTQTFSDSDININTTKIFKPKIKPPQKLEIDEFISKNNLWHTKYQEPFYSKASDYTGNVEIGHRVLKIPSISSIHLQEFETGTNSLNQYRKTFAENNNLILKPNYLKSLKLSYCSHREVILQPLKKPPSVIEVKKWLSESSQSHKSLSPASPEIKFERTKILIPNSPGIDEDLDFSLTLTPCSPEAQKIDMNASDDDNLNCSQIINPKNRKKKKTKSLCSEENKSCLISGVTQQNSFGFDHSVQNLQAARAFIEHTYLTTIVMELHIRTRGDFKPDPEYDAISAIFYSVLNDVPNTHLKKARAKGIIAVNRIPISWDNPNHHLLDGVKAECNIHYVNNENDLITSFVDIISYWDPDILTGYEIQMLSWGYLVDRAFTLSLNIIPLLSRSRVNKFGKSKLKQSSYDLQTDLTGRIILDAWRLMRHEIALQSYTFESIIYHILHKRVPCYSFRTLSFWWDHRTSIFRHRVASYYLFRVDTILELFQKLDFINRTCELAKLFGIMFYEVLSRGSQFRVESMMLRLAKPLNYVAVSPNINQRAHMKAPEYVPLIMEPESKLYNDPVIVLDFQSLYPSIIMAYNYCFTTCLGRVRLLGTNSPFEFGAAQLKVSRKVVEKLSKRDLLNFAPCGVAYVKPKVREGILPRMLKEILDTRLMVKNAMKQNKGDENLQKVLHSRQLGLKLIANVTFGYTAANFSGRMCCVEIMDSILSKARETLQRAIAMVDNTAEWSGRVVYGDTDSLFVMVQGKTKDQAFEIGKKIAEAVTNDNPDPIKLKLEKVYQPCLLQTKKRYVGYMYESPEQSEPVYEAKGIETVRRDGCPAVAKMLQKCLTVLFETKDVSCIKSYVLKQFHKILAGRTSIQDLTFAKEYRGSSGYKPGACVPALELAKKWRATDRRNEPRTSERVPYVIVNGPPGLPLIRLVRSPTDLLNDASLRPNSLYYITKVIIPPLNRCLNLIGADVNTWFNQMPRKHTQYLPNSSPVSKSTISQYFTTKICACCSQPAQDGLCPKCYEKPNVSVITLVEKLRRWESNYYDTKMICQCCTGHLEEIKCISLDCPVLYRRIQTFNDLQQSTYVRELLHSTFS